MSNKPNNSVPMVEGMEDNRIALVFSCPGRYEEEKHKKYEEKKLNKAMSVECEKCKYVCKCTYEKSLAADITGENLDMLLDILSKKKPSVFKYKCRYCYRITNSSDKVHYMAKDSKSQPGYREISENDNLSRLKNEISNYDYIIAFGERARFAVEKLQLKTKVISTVHLGLRGLNHIKIENPKDRKMKYKNTEKRMKRIKKVSECILKAIKL